LQQYNFDVSYRPGKQNFAADCLSRVNDAEATTDKVDMVETSDDAVEIATVFGSTSSPVVDLAELRAETNSDEHLVLIRQYVIDGWPDKKAVPAACSHTTQFVTSCQRSQTDVCLAAPDGTACTNVGVGS